MRAMWSGAVSFGLISVPVKLYSATENHDLRFHQVHGVDDGRIRYKRCCEDCGHEVDYADIIKGLETDEGELITLDAAELEALPTASGNREINVIEFVPAEQVDPLLLDKSYYLEPSAKAAKPYALLRDALRQTDRMAPVKVAIRQREQMALLRVRDRVIVLQTMLWPDEVRLPEFEILDAEVALRPQEMQMASSLVESLGAEFDPTRFGDEYRDAMLELIERKRTGERTAPAPAAATGGEEGMTDLLTALQRSVEAAQAGGVCVPAQRGAPAPEPSDTDTGPKATPDPPSDPDDSADAETRGSKKATKRTKRSHPA